MPVLKYRHANQKSRDSRSRTGNQVPAGYQVGPQRAPAHPGPAHAAIRGGGGRRSRGGRGHSREFPRQGKHRRILQPSPGLGGTLGGQRRHEALGNGAGSLPAGPRLLRRPRAGLGTGTRRAHGEGRSGRRTVRGHTARRHRPPFPWRRGPNGRGLGAGRIGCRRRGTHAMGNGPQLRRSRHRRRVRRPAPSTGHGGKSPSARKLRPTCP